MVSIWYIIQLACKCQQVAYQFKLRNFGNSPVKPLWYSGEESRLGCKM